MCGIAGIYYFDRERRVLDADVTAMRDTMVHRGPDGCGNFVHGHVGLGHRRLSIVDLAGGHQPMANEDDTVWIVFNGEIYNHAEIRPELEAKGHVFRTKSDTEAIIHLYEQEGEAGIAKLKGMFAFAIYDLRRDALLLVRDRMGIKPLYFATTKDGVLFGSEIKAILEYPGFAAAPHTERLTDFLLYGSVYGEETLFRGVSELQPGHLMRVDRSGVAIRQYWDLPAGPEDTATEPEQHEHVLALLKTSIKRRLMSDVPLGAFLSGGVDSSLIVALMAEMIDAPVKTFSIGFAERGYNEFDYSRLVARRFHTDHLEVTLDATQFFDALPKLVWHYDEPIALAASVPLYFLSKETKGKATVILTGEGADELLLGYEKYSWAAKHARAAARFHRLVPPSLRQPLASTARRLFGPERLLLRRLPLSPGDVAASFYHAIQSDFLEQILATPSPEVRSRLERHRLCARAFDGAPAERDFLTKMSYMDFKTFLTTLLMKQDKMSMAASIESRVPFLDHELVEYGFRLPVDRKVRDGLHKKILKQIAERYLPHDLLYREKKGFPVPVTNWFLDPRTRPRFEEVLLDPRTKARGIFNSDVIERHLRGVAAGERGNASFATYLIWYLTNLELWFRTFIDARTPRRAAREVDVAPSVPRPTVAVG